MRRLSLFSAFIFLPFGAAADSTLVFNEIHYHPPLNEAREEWIEFLNLLAVDLDVSQWSIAGGVEYTFPPGTVVKGGGFLVVAVDPATVVSNTGLARVLGPWSGRLSNQGERLVLKNNSGRVMAEIRYGTDNRWPVAPDGSGATLCRLDPDSARHGPENWGASVRVGGTPGGPNDRWPSRFRPPGLVSYWSFDEPSGPALDAVSGNHAQPGPLVRRGSGRIGTGALQLLNFGGSYLNCGPGNVNSFSVHAGITLELVLKTEWSGQAGDYDTLFRKEDPAQRILLSFQHDSFHNGANPPVAAGPALSLGLTVQGVYSELDMPLDGQNGRPTLADLKDGRLHHIVATYDAADGKKSIYVDGVLRFQTTLTGTIRSASPGPAIIGNSGVDGSEPATGLLDELAFWNRALTPAEIAAHHSAMLAGLPYFSPEPEPTVPALRFSEVPSVLTTPFWLELENSGSAPLALEGVRLLRRGGADAEFRLAPGTLAAGGRLVLAAETLGWRPEDGDKLFLLNSAGTQVLDGVVAKRSNRARDATGEWRFPEAATPGEPNSFLLQAPVVIHEIMYHPRPVYASGEIPFQRNSEAWIELYNRSSAPVNLTGWRLDEGIDFQFPPGTTLPAGGYLVVARDAEALKQRHPEAVIVGNFNNQLSRKGERIVLKDPRNNPVNLVHYRDSDPWPEYADGLGSSLELKDPFADNRRPEAWAASDESARSGWRSYSYEGVAAPDTGPTTWREWVVGLLDAGECLLDDIRVTDLSTQAELVWNGDFQQGALEWRFLGNHSLSRVIADPEDPVNAVLHLVATGPTEHMHNHIETTLATNAAVVNGRTYRVSFRARWLAGSPQLNTRLYFNRVARTTLLEQPSAGGTPGAPNSRGVDNLGPTFHSLRHAPVTPAHGQPVTVRVGVEDPDGIGCVALWWRWGLLPWTEIPMAGVNGLFEASLPGLGAGTLVHFYIEAVDGRGAAALYPPQGPDSRALYQVNDGLARTGPIHALRVLMTQADTNQLFNETNLMSNARLRGTVVFNESIPHYNAGIRLKGSQRGRVSDSRIGYNIRFPSDHLFRGIHSSVSVDRSGGWRFGRNYGQDEIVIKHMIQHAGQIPGMYNDLIWVVPPRLSQAGPAMLQMAGYGPDYLDGQYEQGSEGTAWEYELIYYPTTTALGVSNSAKKPAPDQVVGTDIRDLGTAQEAYRWNFLIENNRARDDYGPLIALARAFSLTGAALQTRAAEVMDVDQWMRAFAMMSLCGVGDSYTWGNNHNLVLYARPSDQRVLAFPWDWDFAFTQPVTAPLSGDQNLAKIIALPVYQRLFHGHLLDLMATTFNTNYMAYWTDHYDDFTPGQDFSSFVGLIAQRSAHVRSLLPPQFLFHITTRNGQDFSTNSTEVVLEGKGWVNVRTIHLDPEGPPLHVEWTSSTNWLVQVPLVRGKNRVELFARGYQKEPVGSDLVHITTTAGDTDGDGIPDSYELTHGLDRFRNDAHLDKDGDGATNLEEYLAGTRADSADSVFRIDRLQREGEGWRLQFRAVSNRTYRVQFRDQLVDSPWRLLKEFPPQPDSGSLDAVDPGAPAARFYRVVTP